MHNGHADGEPASDDVAILQTDVGTLQARLRSKGVSVGPGMDKGGRGVGADADGLVLVRIRIAGAEPRI